MTHHRAPLSIAQVANHATMCQKCAYRERRMADPARGDHAREAARLRDERRTISGKNAERLARTRRRRADERDEQIGYDLGIQSQLYAAMLADAVGKSTLRKTGGQDFSV